MLTLLYTLSVLLMIVMPVVFAVLLRRRIPAPWLLFIAGVLTFLASQAIHLPLNNWLTDIGVLPGGDADPPLWQTALVLGLTAGLCEELARTAGYALLRRYRAFGDGLMMGLGHGGVESMVFGGVFTAATIGALLPLQNTDLTTLTLAPEQLAAIEMQLRALQSSPWLAFLPLIERLLAMGIQVTLSIIVWRAFVKRNALYVVAAIAYHTAIDMVVVTASQSSLSAWVSEGLIFLIALPGYLWLAWGFRRQAPAQVSSSAHSLQHEAAVFWTALRKELLQQWRTRRVLIVVAVFILFGMFSPLIAYLTPKMLTAIPGAEQFAALVPTPTAGDAMQQYIKNLTQFGFILALLLGMGAVAGEKEHGTASLVLSKPMTRSAFITSKFTAQFAVYLLGFALALIGAYFYTVAIFGDLEFGPFALLNLVLIFWLLPYVAVTLLGSVIGNTTSAAAGISMAGVVILLIASSIPQISALMPGALAGWAGQLGIQAAGGLSPGIGVSAAQFSGPAIGALAGSITLTIICLLTGIAIFEQQEL